MFKRASLVFRGLNCRPKEFDKLIFERYLEIGSRSWVSETKNEMIFHQNKKSRFFLFFHSKKVSFSTRFFKCRDWLSPRWKSVGESGCFFGWLIQLHEQHPPRLSISHSLTVEASCYWQAWKERKKRDWTRKRERGGKDKPIWGQAIVMPSVCARVVDTRDK